MIRNLLHRVFKWSEISKLHLEAGAGNNLPLYRCYSCDSAINRRKLAFKQLGCNYYLLYDHYLEVICYEK